MLPTFLVLTKLTPGLADTDDLATISMPQTQVIKHMIFETEKHFEPFTKFMGWSGLRNKKFCMQKYTL